MTQTACMMVAWLAAAAATGTSSPKPQSSGLGDANSAGVAVLDDPAAAVAPSTAKLLSVRHDLTLSEASAPASAAKRAPLEAVATFRLKSTFTFDAASLAASGDQLLFGGPSLGDVSLRSAAVDGRAVTPVILRPHPWTVQLPLAPGRPASGRLTAEIVYEASRPGGQKLYRVGAGLLLKPARLVDAQGRTTWDIRPLSPFSYADPVSTSWRVKLPPGFQILAGGEPGASPLAQPVVIFGRKADFTAGEFSVAGTTFRVILPRRDAGFRAGDLKRIIAAAWPRLVHRLGPVPTRRVTFVEADDGSLSGGLFGDGVVGLFFRAQTTPFEGIFIRNILGWAPAPSTRAYVEREYQGVKDPWLDYLTGMVTHELAHFWFGFGKTTERVVETADEWTSLGLGLVYDTEISRELTGREPVLFAASERVWREQWAHDALIDQRLERPDTRKDPKALARVQTYAHSKALWTFRQLRTRLGPERFDQAVRAYLAAAPSDPDQGWPRLRRELTKVAPETLAVAQELGL